MATSKILYALSGLALLLTGSTAVAYPEYTEGHLLETSKPIALKSLCVLSKGRAIGTTTVIGTAHVTAKHVVTGCEGTLPSVWSSPEGHDIAIVKYGDPGVCKDAEIGELLVFSGWPGSKLDGEPISNNRDFYLEVDTGVARESGMNVRVGKPDFPYYEDLKNVYRADTSRIRGGYSGGPVRSLRDGRIVGILNASSSDRTLAFFTPISTVCKMIRKEPPYE